MDIERVKMICGSITGICVYVTLDRMGVPLQAIALIAMLSIAFAFLVEWKAE